MRARKAARSRFEGAYGRVFREALHLCEFPSAAALRSSLNNYLEAGLTFVEFAKPASVKPLKRSLSHTPTFAYMQPARI